ncbi:MAG: hypothetical protein M3Q10_09000, partial [Chloroflexota bacterium]|nr:hypothetical protein [Chloroflexota bacterium]
ERVGHVRRAGHGDNIYLDLGNDAWEAVEIAPDGWRVVADPSVRFRRPGGLRPLPAPVAGGSVDELRLFINVASETDWRLIVGWLVETPNPDGPYPLLNLTGGSGAAKTTACRVLRSLVDPNVSPLQSLPHSIENLMIDATDNAIVGYDNLSYIQPWLSDALCRLATGGGFATRELYTNTGRVIFEVMRPVILNGIGEVVLREDLLDRSIIAGLLDIPDDKRRDEKEFWAAFGAVHARVLGAILDAASTALRRLPETTLERKPRMADFALWATAASPTRWWRIGSASAGSPSGSGGGPRSSPPPWTTSAPSSKKNPGSTPWPVGTTCWRV